MLWPISYVIAAEIHAIHGHVLIPALGEVSLHRLIRSVRIANQDAKILAPDVIEALLNLRT